MKLLRRLFIFFFVVSIVYILIFFGVNFIFQDTIRKNLEKRLSKSIGVQVDIRGFKTDLITSITFKDIHIKKLSLDILQINFKYFLLSLFQNRFKGKIEFKDLFFKDSKIGNLLIDLSFKPLFKPKRVSLKTEIPSLSYPDFFLKDLSLNLNFLEDRYFGDFLIRALNYKKLKLNNINSKISSQDKKINLENLKADIFEGKLSGEAKISFLPPIGYDFNFKMTSLNLKEITERFAPPDWRAKGEISGEIKIRIEGKDPKDLKGDFYSEKTGAINMKAIRRLLSETKAGVDKKMLKRDVFLYENLSCNISLLGDDIVVELKLEGKEAELKFDINIEKEVLYSFFSEKR